MRRMPFALAFLPLAVAAGFWLSRCDDDSSQQCTTHDHIVCYNGSTFWLNSCGVTEELIEQCQCGCNAEGTDCKDCPCVPECTDRCCGDDGCGGTCQDNCGAGYLCNTSSCQCEPGCPPDMVEIPSSGVCIDRYEASRDGNGQAQSVADENPWVGITWDEAQAACQAVGKRLCDASEWTGGCQGSNGYAYPYGNQYDMHACNGADHGVGQAVLTGSMAGCEGGYSGVFDMSGNIREWTAECTTDTCDVYGGSWSEGQDYLRCDAGSPDWKTRRAPNVGFRCCMSL